MMCDFLHWNIIKIPTVIYIIYSLMIYSISIGDVEIVDIFSNPCCLLLKAESWVAIALPSWTSKRKEVHENYLINRSKMTLVGRSFGAIRRFTTTAARRGGDGSLDHIPPPGHVSL